MTKAIGVDIVDLSRLKLTDAFINKVLTKKEIEVFKSKKTIKNQREYLGGRFAAKEAYFKTLGDNINDASFQGVEVLNKPSGQPYLNISNSHLSISHDNNYVIAFVVIEGE